MDIEKLKFPIGKFQKPTTITQQMIAEWINVIANFPKELKKQVAHLSEKQLNTRYRPDGWTIKQVVHHCADSHMNSLIRFKLALTENEPTIKPYEEQLWAELNDTKLQPVAPSLHLLEGLHQRWCFLLHSLSENDYTKTFVHPETGSKVTLGENTAIYAWHCKHHLAHIGLAKQSMVDNI